VVIAGVPAISDALARVLAIPRRSRVAQHLGRVVVDLDDVDHVGVGCVIAIQVQLLGGVLLGAGSQVLIPPRAKLVTLAGLGDARSGSARSCSRQATLVRPLAALNPSSHGSIAW
jgi:hypothetical protein